MSCLTRKMQQQLTRYVQKNSGSLELDDPQAIREKLVKTGVCPSTVTSDQMRIIVEDAITS